MPLLGALVLVATVAAAPATPEPELPPLPALFDETLPAAPPAPVARPTATPVLATPAVPAPRAAPTPVLASPPPPAAASAPAPKTPATAPDAAERPSLVRDLPWIEWGSGTLALELTGLAGAPAVRTGGAVAIGHGPWTLGFGVLSGGNDTMSLTTGALSGGFRFLSLGAVELGGGASFLLGAAGRPLGTARENTAVVGLAPELTASARILPWLHGRAAVSYRLVDAWAWGGPSGDQMGGFAVTAGLVFGAP